MPLRSLAEVQASLLRRRQKDHQQKEDASAQEQVRVVRRFPERLWAPKATCEQQHGSPRRSSEKSGCTEDQDAENEEQYTADEDNASPRLEKEEVEDLVRRLTKRLLSDCDEKTACTLPAIHAAEQEAAKHRRISQPDATARLAAPRKAPEPSPQFVIPPLDAGDVECLVDRLHSDAAARKQRLTDVPPSAPKHPKPSSAKNHPITARRKNASNPPRDNSAVSRLYDLEFYIKRNRHGHFQGDGYVPMANEDFMLLSRPPLRAYVL